MISPKDFQIYWLSMCISKWIKWIKKKPPWKKKFCIFFQYPHQVDIKNVVECPREFFAYFNALETTCAMLMFCFWTFLMWYNLQLDFLAPGLMNCTAYKSHCGTWIILLGPFWLLRVKKKNNSEHLLMVFFSVIQRVTNSWFSIIF